MPDPSVHPPCNLGGLSGPSVQTLRRSTWLQVHPALLLKRACAFEGPPSRQRLRPSLLRPRGVATHPERGPYNQRAQTFAGSSHCVFVAIVSCTIIQSIRPTRPS